MDPLNAVNDSKLSGCAKVTHFTFKEIFKPKKTILSWFNPSDLLYTVTHKTIYSEECWDPNILFECTIPLRKVSQSNVIKPSAKYCLNVLNRVPMVVEDLDIPGNMFSKSREFLEFTFYFWWNISSDMDFWDCKAAH